MLRTHRYEFIPGKTVFKAAARVTSEAQIPLSPKVIISACGSGMLRVREIGTGDPEDESAGPGEWELPYTKGTYVLDLPFRWPVGQAWEAINLADDGASVVRIVAVRSQEADGIQVTREVVTSDGTPVIVGNVGPSATFPTRRVIIKCSSEADNPFAYSGAGLPDFATSAKLYPGESLPEIEVRRAFTLYTVAQTSLLESIVELIEVPT